MKATKKLIAMLLCAIMLLALVPAAAFADSGDTKATVEIESQTNSAFDYLEYYSGGKWKDLNTPRHWIKSTGQVCYCIEHSEGNPHGATYTAAPPSSVFSSNTLQGLQTILMFGYFQNIELYGAPNWYDWCCEHWNTKWNAYECLTVDPMDRRLEFLTAWSSVPPIVEAISLKFPDAVITYRWADEDIGHNVGEVVIQNGNCLEDRSPEDGTKAAYEMAAEIMGEDLEDWGLTLSEDGSTYEWHDMDPVPEPVSDRSSKTQDAR